MNQEKSIKEHLSAGGLLVNTAKGVAYLICKKERNHWQLPKGHVNGEETIKEAAIREIYEETGYKDLTILSSVPPIKTEYNFELAQEPQFLHHKTVHFFLATLHGHARDENTQEKDEGLDGAWFPLEEVVSKLSHKEEKAVAKNLINELTK